MNPDRARELLTTELSELDDRAEFAAATAPRPPPATSTANEGTTHHPADFGTDVTNRWRARASAQTVELQRAAWSRTRWTGSTGHLAGARCAAGRSTTSARGPP